MPKRSYGLPEVENIPPMPSVKIPNQASEYLYCPAIKFHGVYGRVEEVETNVDVLLGLGWKLFGTPFPYKDGIYQAMVLLPKVSDDIDIITESGDGC